MKRCWVEIYLSELESNLQKIREMVPISVKIISVIKADAYGHGIQATATRLMQSGADMFAVANLEEALAIRELGVGWPILILSPLLPIEYEKCLQNEMIPTISNVDEARFLSKNAHSLKKTCPIHFKVDTGMGRVGSWYEEAVNTFKAIQSLDNISVQGIYTHFATSDIDLEFTKIQRIRFDDFLKQINVDYSNCMIHADNSAGLDSFDPVNNLYFNAVRVGLIQFGASPRKNSVLNKLIPKPVLSFHTRVGLIKELPRDTPVSYNHTFITKRRTKIAILTAGYGDGIPLGYSNCGKVLINNHYCPIIGRVTMDQCIVDVTDLQTVSVGDQATLIGKQEIQEITLEQFAKDAKSIPWEVLCSITQRVDRIYKTARQ